ncbi:hypothetical protein DFR29_103325 [Tahibacter aquaticus]|uniref:Anti-sigma-K factor RskA n=1 Tax=Tahibacter aquaticus TaxID=520092 RepID=A0A4R6Z5E3_9GAMM|nr:hypothetical protein [Tahibacter aquaticus]TDR46789.1 hypothetical protein DFR29_103325 [Tahibacter aquaticus]
MISALDNHLLRTYLDGEMDEAATEAFEVLMIERPELAELVDADTALRMALGSSDAALPAQGSAVFTTPVDTAAPSPKLGRTRRPHWFPLLAAASVLLAVGMGLGRLWVPQSTGLVPTTLFSVDRIRGSDREVRKLRVPVEGQIVLSVPVTTESSCISLVRVSQSGIVLEALASPDDYGFANFSVPATRLAPGNLEVSVACDGQVRASYTVELVH